MAYTLRDFKTLRDELVSDGWKSPDTYSNEFAEITNKPAVYLFLLFNKWSFEKALVSYVGMSTKLRQRMAGHPILAETNTPDRYSMRWFKPVSACDLRLVESRYIAKFDPPWNIIGRPRGVVSL